jgi:hypothetical protein
MKKNLTRNALFISSILLIPLALTTGEGKLWNIGWNWSLTDFVTAFVILFSASAMYEFLKLKVTGSRQRTIVAGLISFAVFVLWVELATSGISRAIQKFLN